MKKIFALLISLLVVFATAAPAEDASGDWYASLNGLPVHLALGADGTYTVSVPAEAPASGRWELRDGFVYLEGEENSPLNLMDGTMLIWTDACLIFTREKEDGYVPGSAWADAPVILYSDYWKAAYADVAGTPVPAFALEDETDLYVEGHSAILGGPVLGDVIVKLAERDGALVTEEGSAPAAELVLQQDGLLRLTVTGSGTAPQTWYMMRSYSAALDGETEEAQEEKT